MTQPKSSGKDGASKQDQRLYGTQFSSFGSDADSLKSSSDDERPGDNSGRPPAETRRATFGTQFPAATDQQAVLAANAGKVPHLEDQFEAVNRTRHADPIQLQRVAATMPPVTTSQVLASRIGSVPELEKTLVQKQTSGDAEQPVGKSTWDLRIHRRDVDGQITGIINPIPASGDAVTGLQSALAVDDDSPEYEILGQLGAGNMGVVYHARQLSLNRELAIKTLKPTSTQVQHNQAMFVSEAVVTANLVHPNIIPIHDLGCTEDGKLFYSMKKVSGVSWNEIIRERTLEDNLDIYMKLCDAVAYAHSRGAINRDLKPENVVVGSFGEVVVLDWGLAITTERFEKRRSVLVDFRGGAGTPVYMAPELLDDDLSRIGPPSDIYLLGAILFEVLEGFPPHLLRRIWHMTEPEEQFDAVIHAVMYNEIEEDVVHRGELMQIARKAMSTEPGDRYLSVEALQDAIREYRITGRAEELMNSVDSSHATDYTIYQSAVAMYDEALLKWPDNLRALNGDRNARLAYAALALKKGDIDLGLQIVRQNTDPAFALVSARLKKTRLIRKIIRGTWGVTTVSAVSLLILSFLAYSALVEKNGELDDVQQKVAQQKDEAKRAKAEAETANEKAQLAAIAADAARINGETATRNAAIEVEKSNVALKLANEAKQLALDAATKANQEAITQEKAARDSEVAAKKAKADEMVATSAAISAKAAAAAALTEKYKYEYEGFKKQIDAAHQLSDFNEVIRIAKEALAKADTNPLIKENEVVLQKQIQSAESSGGNAQIPLPNEPTSASISDDGSTVIAYFAGLKKSVIVFRDIFSDIENRPLPQTVPVILKGDVKIAVTKDGNCFCVGTPSGKQFWRLQNDGQYHELRLTKEITQTNANSPIKKILCSPSGKHFYAIGNDRDATLEIYAVNSNESELLLRQRLTGGDDVDFRVRDVALLPDESALIVQFENQKCFEFRLIWTDDAKPQFDQKRLSRNAAAMNIISIPEHPQITDTPQKLFVSPDGQRLGLVFGETVVFLPKIPNATADQFSFATPDTSADFEILKATYPVDEVQFSTLHDVPRIATGHRKQFLEIWDLAGKTYEPCRADALYKHQLKNGTIASCLRGHSREVKAFTFAGGNGDRMVSVSADQSIRTWEISNYAELGRQIRNIRETFEQDSRQPSVLIPAANFEFRVADAACDRRDAVSRIDASSIQRLRQYTLTAGPLSQPPETTEPHRILQGQSVFSARFSQDASRILVGADDLAAHAFDSQTGKEILIASMIGRKDLLFNPSRNMFLEGHVAEISTISFLPPKGDLLLSADYFGSISVWDAVPNEDGVGFERSRLLSEYSFSEFAVSDDGSLVFAGGATTPNPEAGLEEAKLQHKGVLWQTEDIRESPVPAPLREFEGRHSQFAITALAIAPSCELVVTAGRRGKMVVWNVADGNVIAEADGQHSRDQVSGIFFESETQLVSSGYDGKVLRSTVSGDKITAVPVKRSEGQSDPAFIIRLRPSPDRQRFATSDVSLLQQGNASQSGQVNITIWSKDGTRSLLTEPIAIPENRKEQAFFHDVSWSSDGRELMLVHDGIVAIFETVEWKLVRKFNCSDVSASPLRGAFAPAVNGRSDRIATFDGRVCHMWDLPQDGSAGLDVAEFRSHARYSVTASFSSHDEYVATASETLRIFDADEKSSNHGETLYRLPVGIPHKSPLADTAFSPTPADLKLATVDNHGTLAIWRWVPAAPKPLKMLCEASPDELDVPEWATDLKFGNAISWSSEGKSLATLQNGVASLWTLENDVPGHIELPMPDGFQCRFNQLQFSRKDPLLTAGGVAWSETNGDMFSFAGVWDTTDESPRLVARIVESDSMYIEDSQNERRTGFSAIAVDDLQNEIITGGVKGRLVRWQVTRSTDGTVPMLSRIVEIRIDRETEDPHTEMITAIDISLAGQLLTADKGGHVILWPKPKK